MRRRGLLPPTVALHSRSVLVQGPGFPGSSPKSCYRCRTNPGTASPGRSVVHIRSPASSEGSMRCRRGRGIEKFEMKVGHRNLLLQSTERAYSERRAIPSRSLLRPAAPAVRLLPFLVLAGEAMPPLPLRGPQPGRADGHARPSDPRKRGRIDVAQASPLILPCEAGEGDHEVVEGVNAGAALAWRRPAPPSI